MSIFEHDSYKSYLLQRIQSLPKNGRGQFKKIAAALGVHTTMISHVLKGDLHFNLEHAADISLYFTLSPLETEYLLLLVQLARAGTPNLQNLLLQKREELRQKAHTVSQRVGPRQDLKEKDKAIYYSEWFYSAIRLQTAIPGFQDIETLAHHFDIPRERFLQVLNFLRETGLCEVDNGQIKRSQHSTHIDARSPLVTRHHRNWRFKVMQELDHLEDDEMAFTAPVTLAHRDQKQIRRLLLEVIAQFDKVVDPSPPERLSCLTIDWVQIKK